MRVVGKRKDPAPTFSPSAELLAEGARLNEELHRLPTGKTTFIPKGVYHFKTHDEANRHQRDCIAKGMAQTALLRAK